MTTAAAWRPEHFSLHEYMLDGPELDGDRVEIRLVIQVNGRKEIDLTSRQDEFEPGLIAFASRPGERGIRVLKALPARGGAIVDGQGAPATPPQWVTDALEL